MQPIPNKPCKVLVVEDEGLIALDISNRLVALGHQVLATAGTSEEALESAAEADIVLMDIRIDGPLDGIETAALIRERFHLPVIFLTAHSDRATIERAKLTSPFGYIVKPIAPASLNSAIEIALYKHKLERRLEQNEALMRSTLTSVPDALIVTDHLSRILLLNQAAERLTGWTQAEVEGQQLLKVMRMLDSESGELTEDLVPLVILKNKSLPFNKFAQLTSRNGRQVMVEGTAAPVHVPGLTLGVVLTFRDVSARLWEEKQIRQAQKVDAAARLASHISDEYSALLATIRGQSENLLRQFGEYSPARRSIEEIQNSAAAAESFTRRLTTFGTRQVAPHPEIFSINGMLRRMSKLIESIAGPKIELAIRPNPSAGKVRVDAAQLEEAIMSLVLHACARMPESGQLLIETGSAELPRLDSTIGYVTLTIVYSGDEPDIEKLFEPTSISDDGLSLALVHGVISEHGGYVSARMTARGCQLEVLLPKAAELLLVGSEPGSVRSVLLVDYREQVRAQLHNFFESQGYNLLEAADDREALALGELHDGALDLLVAEADYADRIGAALQRTHPGLRVLRIVDKELEADNEIVRPFTQTALLDKAAQLLRPREELGALATSS